MKKLTAFILVLIMLLCIAMPVAATNMGGAIQPRYTYIDLLRADLQISSLGVASCEGTVLLKTDDAVKIVIRLQELDGANWMTIKKWEITGSGSISGTGDYAVYSGSSYRVHVTVYVYDAQGNILESDTARSYMDY